MFRFLTQSSSLYAISHEQLEQFKQIAKDYPHISLLVLHEDRLDLFSWRLAMDIYFQLKDQHQQLIYLLERGMVSPVTFFLMRKLTQMSSYQNLTRKNLMTEEERYIYAVYLANTLSKWTYDALKTNTELRLQTGDLAGILRSTSLNIDDLPEQVVSIQSNVVRMIKDNILLEEGLSEQIQAAIKEAYALYYALQPRGV